jgi:hypothetical protein
MFKSATSIVNYVKNDPLPEVLLQNKIKSVSRVGLFGKWIAEKGKEFERRLTKLITTGKSSLYICNEGFDEKRVDMTIKAIQEGIDIIVQAPVICRKYKLVGVVDLLVRSDKFNDIFNMTYLTKEEQAKDTYVVVDIKYRTLNLTSDGTYLINSSDQKAIKMQLYIYYTALCDMNVKLVNSCFIMGRKSSYKQRGVKHDCNNAFGSMGRIEWNREDLKQELENAIRMASDVTDIALDQNNYKFYDYASRGIYPNMKNNSYNYESAKKDIAMRMGELTQLWNVGIKQRDLALKAGITSWFNKKCTAEIMGFSGHKARILNKIIEINRDKPNDGFTPKSLDNSNFLTQAVLSDGNIFCVDFETINDLYDDMESLPTCVSRNMIYMIGLMCEEKGVFLKKQWVADELTLNSEKIILNSFFEFIVDRLQKKNIYLTHWSACAEPRMLDDAIYRHAKQDPSVVRKWNLSTYGGLAWLDMSEVFRQEPIVFYGQFGFGLKEVSQRMKKLGYINVSTGEEEVGNGMDAMVMAIRYYENKETNSLDKICKYNMDDVESLFEIVTWFRKTYSVSRKRKAEEM